MDKNIVIDLTESQNASRFKGKIEESLLQQTALKQVKGIIGELSEKIRQLQNKLSPLNDWAYPRSHDVITINGERGSGKTTFILNILALIPTWQDKKGVCRINNLGILDPTLIEDCEHIFLAVIGKIKEAVDRHWENGRIGSDAETIDARYQLWRVSLTKLARGLRNLGKKKDTEGESWSDPQFILEEGLENSTQGVKLEQHFHCFVEESLNFIGDEAFVIALDDVDTKVDTGWPVLEVLRKYLTTQRLIVILSGDIELYTQLISNKQCEQIGVEPKKIIEMIDIDKQRILPPEYAVQRDLVNDLTEQYMMKIMRPDFRIEMQTVAQIAKQLVWEGGEIVVSYYPKAANGEKPQKKEASLNKILTDFCDKIYGFKNRQNNYLAQVLTEVPTRTCIQLLNTATKFPAGAPITDWKEPEIRKNHLEAVAGLGHVFQNALARAGLSSKLVNEVDAEHMTLGRLAMALHKENLLRQGVNLFPNIEKTWQRQLMMVLGAVYSRSLTTRLGMPFEYLVYMCLPAYLQGVLDPDPEFGLFKKYLAKSQLETGFEAINTVKWGLRAILEDPKVKNEIEIDKTVKYCLVKADGSLQTTSWHRYLLNMASVFAETETATQCYISFYALLGAIATLAGSVSGEGDNKSVIEIMRQYGSEDNPKFDNVLGRPASDDEESAPKTQSDFGKLFAKWCWFPPDKPVPLLVLTESWNRFASATKQLKIKDIGVTVKPGTYIQDFIILYLSHLLEYEMNIMNIPITTKHDGNDSIEKRFENNVSSYKTRLKTDPDNKCRIFDYVFSCPMWMHFLEINDTTLSSRNRIITYYKEKVSEIENGKIDIADICTFTVKQKQFVNLSGFLNNEPAKAKPQPKTKNKAKAKKISGSE